MLQPTSSGQAPRAGASGQSASKPAFTCRVIYWQATTETDQSISDPCASAAVADALAIRYVTSSW